MSVSKQNVPITKANSSSHTASCCGGNRSSSSSSAVNPNLFKEIVTIESKGLAQHWPSKLGLAGLFFGTGMLLRQMATYPGLTDWKVFAKPILGLLAVNKINQAFGLKLPPWLTAIETVGDYYPVNFWVYPQALKQFVIIAPIIAIMVQLISMINRPLSNKLESSFNIPPWVTRLALSVGFIALGMKFMPLLYKPFIKMGWLKGATRGEEFAMMQTCPRGCSVGTGGICMTEIVENLGALFAGTKRDSKAKPSSQKQEGHDCCQ